MNKILIDDVIKHELSLRIPFANMQEVILQAPYRNGSIVELENGDMVKITNISSLIRREENMAPDTGSGCYIEGVIGVFSNSIGWFVFSNYRIIFNVYAIKYIIAK